VRPKLERPLLFTCFLLLATVELLPIALFSRAGGLWLLNNFEDFDFLFWPPLNVAFAPSHFFFHVGAISWACMKPVHALTAAWTGSPLATLAYFQTFGYLTRGIYAALMLAVPLGCWWRRRNVLLAVAVMAMGFALHLATPYMLHMYHMRVGTQLTNKLLILLTAALTLDALLAVLDGRRPSHRRVFAYAMFAGIVFAEIPSYILFFLPLVLFSHTGAPNLADIAWRTVCWVAGGLGGLCLGFLLFYGTDWESALSGAISLGKGLLSGFPQPQPGFRERFIENLFNRKDDYYWVHVSLATHSVMMMMMISTVALSWRQIPGRIRYVSICLAAAFPVVWLAHSRIWATRGSYTSVFSLVYYGIFSVLLGFAILLVLRRNLPSGGWRRMLCGTCAGLIMTAVIAQCCITVREYRFKSAFITQHAIGQSFRSLSAVIDQLPKPINLKFVGLPDLPFMLPGHYAMAGFFLHAGEDGWNAEDLRISPRLREQRFPDYRPIWSLRATDIGYDYFKRKLKIQAEEGWPPMPDSTVIARLPQPISPERIAAMEAVGTLLNPNDLPRNQTMADYLLAAPNHGLAWSPPKGFPWARWVLLPLSEPALLEEVANQAWPPYWERDRHRFFLVKAQSGQCIIALPITKASTPPLPPGD